LDYDGTLVPIRRRPDLASLRPERRAELARLGRKALVGIVSGRPVDELRRIVGVPGLAYIGNHGLEIRAKGRTWVHPGAVRQERAIGRAAAAIGAKIRGFPGAFVEDKRLTVSVHFRQAAARHYASLRSAAAEEVRRSGGGLALSRGKKVLEIKPDIRWDKGRGVLKLLRWAGGSRRLFPIYIGDDRTDEDAFRSLRDRGLTIRVGSGRRTLARCRLRGVDDVWEFLDALRRLIASPPAPN
jgi:trehalose-phosphatase